MILTIALRELRSMFLSPLAWTVLAVVQIIMAWMFFTQIDAFFAVQSQLTTLPNAPGVVDLVVAPLFQVASIVLLMVAPLLTMRLISEERRNGTLSLLLSAPVNNTEIVLGKYLGIVMFMFLFVSMITLMPLSLSLGTTLDYGKLFAGVLALFLLLSAFSAAGLYMSSLTSSPIIAAISTFGMLLLLWVMQSGGAHAGSVTAYLSLLAHFSPMLRGLINTTDLIYFALFIIIFVVLSIRQMDSQRLQN